jgi:uncharacterized membrane protein
MSIAVAPTSWATPAARRPSGGAIVVASIFAIVGLLIVSVGFALPMALRLIEGGRATVPAADLALLRGMAADGAVIVVAGVIHMVVALAVLLGGRAARAAATVLAGSGIAVSVVGFVASAAAWGPFAGTGLARPGQSRADGLGITLATVFVEVLVLLALRAAVRADEAAA